MQSGARVYLDETNLKLFYEYGQTPSISTVPIVREPERPHCEMTLTSKRIKIDKDKQEAERQALLEELRSEAKRMQELGIPHTLDEEKVQLRYECMVYRSINQQS